MSADFSFQALRTHQAAGGSDSRLEQMSLGDLSSGELVVRTRWAGINYKDSLAVTGQAKVLRGAARVAGIELVGTVIHSESPAFATGAEVLVHGFGTGIDFDGGFSEVARVSAAHAMSIPLGLDARAAAVLGVPAFTVAMALERFEALGLCRDQGPIAVSGATGAVGMMALAILARAGYEVVALTRRTEWAPALRALGAHEVLPVPGPEDEPRPLEAGLFAAAIDNVGGETLSWLLRSLKERGLAASVGNASGIRFACNVLPFILRQVQLFGVAANAPWEVRHRLWRRLCDDWMPDMAALGVHVHEVTLDTLAAHCARQVAGQTTGRTLLRLS